MYWNYRVRKTHFEAYDEDSFDIVTVYYENNGTIMGYSEETTPHGGSLEDLEQDLEFMRLAVKQPALTPEELDNEPKEAPEEGAPEE